MDYPPRRIINMLRRGFIEEVFKSDSMLRCVACYACMAKCPRGIRLSDVLLPLVKEQTLIHLPEIPPSCRRACRTPCATATRWANPRASALTGSPRPRRRSRSWPRSAPGGRALVRRVLHLLLRARPGQQPRHGQAASTRWASISPSSATRRNAPATAASSPGRSGLFETLTDYNMEIFQKYQLQAHRHGRRPRLQRLPHPLPACTVSTTRSSTPRPSSPSTSTA